MSPLPASRLALLAASLAALPLALWALSALSALPELAAHARSLWDWRHAAVLLSGGWTGYVLLALVAIAFIRRIPQRCFLRVRQTLAQVFPAGRRGRARQSGAVVENLTAYPDGVLEVICRPTGDWPGHQAGQCVLADFAQPAEGVHPFILAGAWNPADGRLTLAIKASGDHTGTLRQHLSAGSTLRLEGPYGDFTFDADRPGPQVWVAGGIGITPFLARLQDLAARGGSPAPVDFFYCTAGSAPGYPRDLPALCRAAGIRLHRVYADQHGPLTPEAVQLRLRPGATLWFCGPATWGRSLERALLRTRALARGSFHHERFEFR